MYIMSMNLINNISDKKVPEKWLKPLGKNPPKKNPRHRNNYYGWMEMFASYVDDIELIIPKLLRH